MKVNMKSNSVWMKSILRFSASNQLPYEFMIIAEIGDFNRFDSPDKILAYAGLSPSTYQSGQLDGAYSHMEKRGSRYLRYALYNAAKYVCHWDPTFAEYLAKKRAEGKHYNAAISHAVKGWFELFTISRQKPTSNTSKSYLSFLIQYSFFEYQQHRALLLSCSFQVQRL